MQNSGIPYITNSNKTDNQPVRWRSSVIKAKSSQPIAERFFSWQAGRVPTQLSVMCAEQTITHSLQAEDQSIYDEPVQPDQVIEVPVYFTRYIPLPALNSVWLYIGLRQVFTKQVELNSPTRINSLHLQSQLLIFRNEPALILAIVW